jgi:F-type H+-transporting ATPase subunit epsilon
VTLQVALVVPDRQLWSGTASIVIAKTTEGDIGILGGHAPVFGVLAEGSLVEIVPEDGGERVKAAVSGGFLSVADDKVSILAAEARLGGEVNAEAARQDIEQAEVVAGAEEPADVKYAKAQLRAAGQA